MTETDNLSYKPLSFHHSPGKFFSLLYSPITLYTHYILRIWDMIIINIIVLELTRGLEIMLSKGKIINQIKVQRDDLTCLVPYW